MIYYVYLHLNSDGEPFYVGSGKDYRAYNKSNRSNDWKAISSKGYDIILLEIGLDKDKSREMESYWIKRIGRLDLNNGPLINKTDGIGKYGYIFTQEDRDKISKRNIGNKFGTSNTGRKQSPEHLEKLSKVRKGRRIENYTIILDPQTGIFYNSYTELAEIL